MEKILMFKEDEATYKHIFDVLLNHTTTVEAVVYGYESKIDARNFLTAYYTKSGDFVSQCRYLYSEEIK